MRHLFLIACVLLTPVLCRAQTEDASQLEWGEVKWSFPRADVESIEINGLKVYRLGKEMLGIEKTHNGRPVRVITLPQKIVTAAELLHFQDPKGMPDVDQFLAALAVMAAVERPADYHNEYIGSGKLDGETVYIYTTKSGANVGAIVTQKRNMVVVMPAPSVK